MRGDGVLGGYHLEPSAQGCGENSLGHRYSSFFSVPRSPEQREKDHRKWMRLSGNPRPKTCALLGVFIYRYLSY